MGPPIGTTILIIFSQGHLHGNRPPPGAERPGPRDPPARHLFARPWKVAFLSIPAFERSAREVSGSFGAACYKTAAPPAHFAAELTADLKGCDAIVHSSGGVDIMEISHVGC